LGTAASFKSPSGVSVDSNGVMYVADTSNHRIRKVLSSGVCLDSLQLSLATSFSVRSPFYCGERGGSVCAHD
jgi:hypothetical protein